MVVKAEAGVGEADVVVGGAVIVEGMSLAVCNASGDDGERDAASCKARLKLSQFIYARRVEGLGLERSGSGLGRGNGRAERNGNKDYPKQS